METEPKYNRKSNIDNLGKIPPQAVDLEEAILGAMLIEKRCIDDVINVLKPDEFYKESSRLICDCIYQMYNTNKDIDILTVTNELKKNGNIENCGGAFYITTLTSRVASTANILSHCAVVKQQAVKREIIKTATEQINDAFDSGTDALDLLDQVNRDVDSINQMIATGTGAVHVSKSVNQSIVNLDARAKAARENKITGVQTGLKRLNEITGGWQPADLIIIAGRPSMGKTAFAIYETLEAALNSTSVCFYSLEMQDFKIADRMLLSISDVSPDRFNSGWVSDIEIKHVTDAAAKLNSLPIYIDPKPSVKMSYIKSHSRLMKSKGKCGMIVIDYLQLVDSNLPNKNREQEVSMASRQAKQIAKELNVPVLLLSQLNRSVETRGGSKKPQLSDLRESGAIEQDADIVIFPHRPEYYDKIDETIKGVVELIIAKNRNGRTGEVSIFCNDSVTKFSDYKIDAKQPDEPEQFKQELPVNETFKETPF